MICTPILVHELLQRANLKQKIWAGIFESNSADEPSDAATYAHRKNEKVLQVSRQQGIALSWTVRPSLKT